MSTINVDFDKVKSTINSIDSELHFETTERLIESFERQHLSNSDIVNLVSELKSLFQQKKLSINLPPMKQQEMAVLSLSGGMDSTCLLLHLLATGQQVHCISFDYGQKHKVELERAKTNIEYLKSRLGDHCVTHQIVDLSSIMSMFESALTTSDIEVPEGHYSEDNMKKTVVPNRNAIFSSVIYGYALSLAVKHNTNVNISLGIHSGDHAIYPDCRPEFRDALEHAFKIGNWDSEKVSYYTPYLHGNKTTILQDSLQSCERLSLDFDTVLANTNTSYNPDSQGRSSGKSGSDIERIEAFLNIGRKDPIEYQSPWEDVVAHAKTVLNK